MQTKRLRQPDIARGIAIICIVLGHLGNNSINRFVFTFHVPVFYLLSGYFLNEQDSLKDYLRKRSRSLLLPYAVTCLGVILMALLLNRFITVPQPAGAVFRRWLGAALYGAGDSYQEPFVIQGIGAVWFLLALFWAGLGMQCLLKCAPGVRPVIVALVFFLSGLSRRLFWFPLSIQAGGTGLLFVYLGYLGKDLLPAFQTQRREIRLAALLGAFWVWGSFIRDFRSFWLVHSDCGRGVVDIFGSLCACACVLYLSGMIEKRTGRIAGTLEYLGKYSLLVLCIHTIELELLPWHRLEEALFGELTGPEHYGLLILAKFLWILPLTVLCEKWSVTRRLFGYH